jgi:hypothetical protein
VNDVLANRFSVARPGRALIAVALAATTVIALIAAASAVAASGGVAPGSGGTTTTSTSGTSGDNLTPPRYDRLWDSVSTTDRRWAHRVAECESGHDPDAVALGGRYLGAFMFTPDAWKTSPKTPGGTPIKYSYRTQAVVAVALMHRDGTKPWPVCG